MFLQINIPTGPYQPSALAILSAQRDAIITIHQHSLKLEVTYMFGCVAFLLSILGSSCLCNSSCYHNHLTSAQSKCSYPILHRTYIHTCIYICVVVITVHFPSSTHTLNQPVRDLSSLSLELPQYHFHMFGPSTNCYLRAVQEMCAECSLAPQPGGTAGMQQNGRPTRFSLKYLTSVLAWL